MVQVTLTFFPLGRVEFKRVSSIGAKETGIGDIALGQPAWPESVLMWVDFFFRLLSGASI
jgi:hypothetical protein